MDYMTIMAEFEAGFKVKEDVNSVSAKRKHFLGVSKQGNRWQARIRHPKLKTDVYLGRYSTPEEAALVVKKKMAEFEEMFKGEDCLRIKRCGNEFQGRKLPVGVRREYGKFRVRIWHPELKKFASFGCYSTCDEAAVVADRKRAELWELYGGRPRGSGECEDDDKVLQETESETEEAAVVADRKTAECEDDDEVVQETTSEVAGKFECFDEQASDVKVPARIKDPVSNDRILLGTCDTLADAIRCYRKDKTVLDTKLKRAEFEEKCMGKADVNIEEDETCVGVSAKREQFLKQFSGVSKQGNKWQARIRHPKLKSDVYLGRYSTPEEAALVVKKKKVEFEETFKGEDGLRMKRCRNEFQGRTLPCGVRRQCGKFRVRIWHPELKKFASFGYYTTCDEAAVVAYRKRAELRELYGGKPRGSSECEDDDKVLQETESETEEAAVVADRKRAKAECEDDDEVVQETTSEVAGEFECSDEQASDVKVPATIIDPVSNDKILLWTNDTLADAISCSRKEKTVLDTKMKRADFEEKCMGKADVNIEEDEIHETCVGVSAKREQFFKQFSGVSKQGNKWQARIRHPKLKTDVYLGRYSTPEEAALVVKKKKAEFEETFKGEDGLRMKRCRNEFQGRTLPCGVRRQCGKFRVRLWHPELKKFASFGYYTTCDEAAVVAYRKRAELRELYGGKPRGSSECEDGDKVLQETESLEAAVVADRKRKKAELREVHGGKVRGNGEREEDEVLLECESEVTGNFECSDEQTSDVKVPAGVRRVRSDEWVARIEDQALNDRYWLGTCDTAEEAIRSFGKERAVQMGYDGFNNFEIAEKLNCEVVDVPDKLECQFVQGSPTSNIEPGTANSACFSDKIVIDKMSRRKITSSLDFDEAVSAGFINEYGQLVGKYRELDEQLWWGLPDENVAARR